MTEWKTEAPVAIVGAGPIGIELAIACKKLDIQTLHFDKAQVGQTIYNYPFQTRFFSSPERLEIAGFPIQTIDQQKCSREEYLAYLRSIVLYHRLNIHTYEEVLEIKKHREFFELTAKSSKGKSSGYRSIFLVLATGGTSAARRLNISGEDLPHVSSKMLDPHHYFLKKTVIIGAKNSAVESALRCFHAGAKVTMIVRNKEFNPNDIKYWLLPELEARIRSQEIECFYNAEVKEITQDRAKIFQDGRTVLVPADFIIKAIGFNADMNLFEQLGVSLSGVNNAPRFEDSTMETNVRNVFVLGTATAGTQSKYKIFIENCHVHVVKVIHEICKRLGKVCPEESLGGMGQKAMPGPPEA